MKIIAILFAFSTAVMAMHHDIAQFVDQKVRDAIIDVDLLELGQFTPEIIHCLHKSLEKHIEENIYHLSLWISIDPLHIEKGADELLYDAIKKFPGISEIRVNCFRNRDGKNNKSFGVKLKDVLDRCPQVKTVCFLDHKHVRVKYSHMDGEEMAHGGLLSFIEDAKDDCRLTSLKIYFPMEETLSNDLAKFIQTDSNIQELVLSGSIGKNYIAFICSALEINRTVKTLFLDCNKLDDNAIEYVAKMLKINNSLVSLCLTNNQISDHGVKSLCLALKDNQALEHLYLDRNNITNKSGQLIMSLLRSNKNIKILNVASCPIAITWAFKINDILEER